MLSDNLFHFSTVRGKDKLVYRVALVVRSLYLLPWPTQLLEDSLSR